jgi:hypothetical protein
MEKTGPKSYGGYAWAEESLLPGGTSPLIISNDDDDLASVSELFATADPAPNNYHCHSRRGYPQAADLGGCAPE